MPQMAAMVPRLNSRKLHGRKGSHCLLGMAEVLMALEEGWEPTKGLLVLNQLRS
jgi:hypothetical protein